MHAMTAAHAWHIILEGVAAFGAGGLIVGFLDRRHASKEAGKARDHATSEAQASRRFEVRLEAYKAASVHLERLRMWVECTLPMIGPKPDPPDLAPDDAWTELSGIVAVSLSDDAMKAMQAVNAAAREFMYVVSEVKAQEENPLGQPWDPNYERTPRKKLEDVRAKAFAAIEEAQRVMREELAELQ